MLATKADADQDGVIVPTTLEQYCVTAKPRSAEPNVDIDFYDDDYLENNADTDDDEGDDNCDADDCEEGDSGHGDS